MSHNGSGPPDKTAILDASLFKTADDYNTAATILYQEGYEFAYNVPGTSWSLYQAYQKH